jgi:hypothetical protein
MRVARYTFVSNFYRVVPNGSPLEGLEFFCYTYILGFLVLQFVTPRWQDVSDRPLIPLVPNKYWLPAAIKFWPYEGEILWPPEKYLGGNVIEHFINRFNAPISVPLK